MMNGKCFKFSGVMAIVTFLAGCSPSLPPDSGLEKIETDVNQLTVSLFKSMSDGAEVSAFETLLDDKAREKISSDAFVAMSKKIASKLGALKSLESGGRSDFDPYSGGLLARVMYVGHFEKGDGDISIAAVKLNDRWRIMSFNINSPLLLDNPKDYRERVELYVSNSDLVMPGAHAKVVAQKLGNKVLVADAQVLNVRWKVSATNAHEGFITMALSQAEAAAVKDAQDLAVKSN